MGGEKLGGVFVRAKWKARDIPSVSGALVYLWRLHGRFRRGCIL